MSGSILKIASFWKAVLPSIQPDSTNLEKPLAGWHESVEGLATFTEAPLSLADYSGQEIADFKILLVSAPGAVGKTTLARQLCSETNALYINLAETGVVGSNFITGGLAKTGSTEAWKSGRMGIVIDALDEGRLRVNQAGFTDFLLDVKEIANDRIDARATYPVLFGRTGVIQDTWILLHDWFGESEIGVVEIECYDRETASEFCFRVTKKIRQDRRSKGEAKYVEPARGERKIVELILENLRQKIDAERDADQQRRFAGYAPVLTAVAYRVAEETNPWRFLGRPDVQESVSNISLAEISNNILEREHGKLKNKPNFSPFRGVQ